MEYTKAIRIYKTIGWDDCDFGFLEALGRRPKVDHVIRPFTVQLLHGYN